MELDFPYKAMILDLDGVVTNTRDIHFDAWKETFDEFFKENGIQSPFGEKDYREFVDGRPREDGVRSFLTSRQLRFSEKAIHQLALKKNNLFIEKLKTRGPRVYRDSVEAIRRWKEKGVPVAVVSSSQNCTQVLEMAGIKDLFDVQVDPSSKSAQDLRGKPEADYFVEAARALGIRPEESAVVEDSITGIRAGVKGHFKSVIGMSREGQTPPERLFEAGASDVVDSLSKLGRKENAIRMWDEIKRYIGDKELALFLDFDGTLSDIVSDPSDARPRRLAMPLLKCCSRSLKVAIVSGRDRQDLKKRINEEDLFYAGCHGFDISGPGGFHYEIEEAKEIRPDLLTASELVRNILSGIKGVVVEEKKYFTAIHYRSVGPWLHGKVLETVRSVVGRFKTLEVREGKMVIEMAPHIDWDKGKAIWKLCEVLEIDTSWAVPLYLGDDLTDEDAFQKLKGHGIGIKVGPENIFESVADYWLSGPQEVEVFLNLICRDFTAREKKWRHGS